MRRVGVIGSGSWGTALAALLANNGYQTYLYGRNSAETDEIMQKKQNSRYLPGIKLPDMLISGSDLAETVENAALVVLAVPSSAVRDIARAIKPHLSPDAVVVNTAKGIELGTFLRLSEVIEEELPGVSPVVLSGPSHAEEVARNIPTAIVAACKERKTAEKVQDFFMNSGFRVYTNPDVIGVELGGALKNVIALCTGIADGLGFGDNTKAALMTRGLTEISRLGTALGAQPLTFAGLTGIGDLIVTCTSLHSRNRRAGVLLGQGLPLEEVLKQVGMVVEGVRTTQAAYLLARKLNVEMPIVEQAHRVLFESADPYQAVKNLMGRGRKHESEEVVQNCDWNS